MIDLPLKNFRRSIDLKFTFAFLVRQNMNLLHNFSSNIYIYTNFIYTTVLTRVQIAALCSRKSPKLDFTAKNICVFVCLLLFVLVVFWFLFCFVKFNCLHTHKVTHTRSPFGMDGVQKKECVSMESLDEMCVLFHHIHSTSQCKHWISCLNYTTIHTLECEYNDYDNDTNALHVNECTCVPVPVPASVYGLAVVRHSL